MAYSRSPAVLVSRLDLLTELKNLRECEWACAPGSERSLAHRIREALWIASNIAKTEYPELAQAHEEFRIKETGVGRVIAVRHENPKPRALGGKTVIPIDTEAQTLTDIISVVGAAVDADFKVTFPIVFKYTKLPDSDLLQLHQWISKRTNFLMFYAEPVLTIKEFSEELKSLAFHPDDLE